MLCHSIFAIVPPKQKFQKNQPKGKKLLLIDVLTRCSNPSRDNNDYNMHENSQIII